MGKISATVSENCCWWGSFGSFDFFINQRLVTRNGSTVLKGTGAVLNAKSNAWHTYLYSTHRCSIVHTGVETQTFIYRLKTLNTHYLVGGCLRSKNNFGFLSLASFLFLVLGLYLRFQWQILAHIDCRIWTAGSDKFFWKNRHVRCSQFWLQKVWPSRPCHHFDAHTVDGQQSFAIWC